MKTIRVFPRRTVATPDDDCAVVGGPDLLSEADRILISVAFTYDLPIAERLERDWKYVAPVEIGGPAFGLPSGDFIPGQFLKRGYVITSRGCPNSCWFCSVPNREGPVRTLPICAGWNVLDDNLLACPREHVLEVFRMLRDQPEKPAFTGGIDPALLTDNYASLFYELRPRSIFLAYDTQSDIEPIRCAAKSLSAAGFSMTGHVINAYVLVGFPGDSQASAEQRCRWIASLGIMPRAMLYRSENPIEVNRDWRKFQRKWIRPAITRQVLMETVK